MRISIRFLMAASVLGFITTFNESCTYNNEETLYPKKIDTSGTVDSTISYANRIQPVFNNQCKSCHDVGSGRVFICTAYSNVQAYLSGAGHTDEFIARIDHTTPSPVSYMPQGGTQLPEDIRTDIKKWISRGMRDN